MTRNRPRTNTVTARLDAARAPVDSASSAGSVRQRLLAMLPVAERRLRLNGVSTAVLEGGQGLPVVLLHGPGAYAAKWLRIIPDLAVTHRVIAPDLPGHGASEPIDGPLDMERITAWLDELIECTCETPPALVGQNLGGAIAARFAIDHSERLNRLVLVDALGLAEFQPAPAFGTALAEFVTNPTEDSHDLLWSRCAFNLDALRDRLADRWQSIRAYNLDRARAPGLRDTQYSLMEQFGLPAISPPELARISVPTTLIWGRHDLATGLSIAQAASTRYGWPLHVIENAAADPPLEQPEAFLKALRAALEVTRPGPAIHELPDTRAQWDQVAPGYDEFVTPTYFGLAANALRRAGLRPGMRLLDVAAGSGAVSLSAARLGANVTAVDISPVMIERLETRAREEGLEIDARVMDGHALDLEDDAFDIVASEFGVMLFPDLPRGLREMARVTKPGGRTVVVAFGSPAKVEFLNFFIRAVQAAVPDFTGLPMDPLPLPFQVSDPERLRREMTNAGLNDVRVEETSEEMRYQSGRQLWDWVTNSNPIAGMMLDQLHLNKAQTAVIQHALDRLVAERAAGSGTAVLISPINIGVGMK